MVFGDEGGMWLTKSQKAGKGNVHHRQTCTQIFHDSTLGRLNFVTYHEMISVFRRTGSDPQTDQNGL